MISARHLILGSYQYQVDPTNWLVFVVPPEKEREYQSFGIRDLEKLGMLLGKK